jgi:hypothetical protein
MARNGKRSFFDPRNVSGREALWVAVLLHLILLFLPQSFNPFALFWRDMPVARPEPITFDFKQPEQLQPEQQTELTEQPEKHEAITPERSDDPPETKQPTVQGQTNFKTLETPPQSRQSQQEPREQQRALDTGEQRAEQRVEQAVREPSPREQLEALERSRRLTEALEETPALNPADFPAVYNNPKPSSADSVDGMIQFDTYDWNYEPYRARMLRKIYENWVPKLYTISYFLLRKPGLTVWRFRIQRDGSVTMMQLLNEAQFANYDKAAEYAILAPYWSISTSFPPLPPGFPERDLGVTIGFYVNMDIPSRERSEPTR